MPDDLKEWGFEPDSTSSLDEWGFEADSVVATPAAPDTVASAVKPKKNKVKEIAKATPGVAGEIAKGLVPFAVPAIAEAAVPVMAKKIPVAGQLGFLAGHTANAITDQRTINQLEGIQKTIPTVDLDSKTAEYFGKLQAGLAAKGWTDEQIMREARSRASNVMHGAQATRESIDEQIDQTREDINRLPGKVITDAVFMGLTPKVLGALGSGLAKIGTKAGISVAVKPAEGALARTGASAMKHAATGGVVGGLGVGSGRAADRALEAWAADKPVHEITKSLVEGAKEGTKEGVVWGAALGAAIGTPLEAVANKVSKSAAERVARRAAMAEVEARDLAEASAQKVAWRNSMMDKTVEGFDPHTAQIPPGADPFEAATTIIQQRHGSDAAMSEAGLRAASKIADRIKLYADANEALQGNVIIDEVGPQIGRMSGLLPTGARPGAPGRPQVGTAPERLPEAVQGPIGERSPQFEPPGQVTPVEGLEGAPTPRTEPVPPAAITGSRLDDGAPPSDGPPVFDRSIEPGPAPLVGGGLGVPRESVRPTGPTLDPNTRALGEPSTPVAEPPAPKPDSYLTPKPEDPKAVSLSKRAVEKLIADGEDVKALKLATDAGLVEPGSPEYVALAEKAVAKLEAAGEAVKALKLAEKTGLIEKPLNKTAESSTAAETPKAEAPAPEAAPPKPVEAPAPEPAKPAEVLAPEAVVEQPAKPKRTKRVADNPEQTALALDTDPPKAAEPTPEAPATPAEPAARAADTVVTKLADETHANVSAMEDGKSIKMQLGVKPGEVAKPGGPATAIDRIVKTADEHGVRVETDLVPAPSPKGGKIPLEKLIPWYEARGFKVVESTRIPEGNLATAKLVREPIGTHQSEVEGALKKIGEAAQERINKKSGRLNAGFDPTLIGDYALKLAADMFTYRMNKREDIAAWATERFGSGVAKYLDELVTKAQKHFIRMFKETGKAEQNLDELLSLLDSGKYGMGWYEKTADWAKTRFGDDADMFLRFLAVTSANGTTEGGSAMALKAFAQWKSGMPFEGFRGASMVGQLERAVKNENLGDATKIQNFLEALRGNPDAIVLDRWMIDALNMREVGGSLRPANYKIYEEVVRNLARDNDMTPRQFQAAVWEGARVRSMHIKEAAGGRAASSKTGSSRPLEELVERRLGGLTPEEYVAANKEGLQKMENLYQGLAPVRKGLVKGESGAWEAMPDAPSGHTFDPDSFKPAAHEGHVVSLVSNSAQRNHLYPGRILKFKQDVAPLIEELKAKGLKPTIGIWQEAGNDGVPTGNFSIDLNIMVADADKAMTLGKLARNFEIAKLGEGGAWEQNLKTGYDPAVNGKQFLPPKNFAARNAWHKQQINRARAFLKKTFDEKPKSMMERLAGEGGFIGDKGKNPKHTPERVVSTMAKEGGKIVPDSDLVNKGHGYGSMNGYWISPDGDVIKVAGTHAQMARRIAKSLGLPGVKGYTETAHGAGPQVQALLNMGFIRTQTSGSMIAFDLSHGITPAQRSLLKRAIAAKEDWAAAISNGKGALVTGLSSNAGDKPHHFLAKATEHTGE